MQNQFVIIAMSGGVDSSVAAWLLKKLNYKLIGVFMINWSDNNFCYKKDLNDAIRISSILNIKLKIINYTKYYNKLVFKNFINNYKIGKIPNPDINCNKKIKFKLLLKQSIKWGASKLATGHYAKILNFANNYKLIKPRDKKKDQTYFLYKLKLKNLSKLIFPLGNLYKFEVRKLAAHLKFFNSNKRDSTGICFIEIKNFKSFINKYIKKIFGYIINKNNIIIGVHDGFQFYSLGQKKNIKLITNNNKIYISKKFKLINILQVNNNINCNWLLSIGIIVNKLSWIKTPANNNYYIIKIRHSQINIICLLKYINKNLLLIKFNKLQWGINIGQSVVIYKNNLCLGGGLVKNFINIKN